MAKVTYIKVQQISRRHFEVGCESDDGSYAVDSSYENSVKAEQRAEVLAKLCNCDWGQDY